MALHALSLCAGIGGLDLALRSLGVVSVGYVERDAYAAAVLVARMEEARLDRAPVWSDLATFDARAWRGAVDLVSAGYPCQPFSQAGLKAGEKDHRHLWPDVRRVLGECGAPVLVVENVRDHLIRGFDVVLRDLESDGFEVLHDLFTASGVGSTQKRQRLFVVAFRGDLGLSVLGEAHDHNGSHEPGDVADGLGSPVGDGLREGLEGGDSVRLRPPSRAWPPGPGDRVGWSAVLDERPDLGPAECRVRGVADGVPDWVDRIRCLGNAVVPAQAALAIRELVRRALT